MNFNYLYIVTILIILVSSSGYSDNDRVLILNAENIKDVPARNFRWASKVFAEWVKHSPSRVGLDELKLSGSAQFSKDSLVFMHKKLGSPSKLFVVDLREESHGFVNGNAVSWYAYRNWSNEGKSAAEVEKIEKGLLNGLKKEKEIDARIIVKDDEGGIESSKKFLIEPKDLETEEELVKSLGWNYVRIPVTDHVKPSSDDVKAFLEFYKNLPSDGWVHFHCAAGDGRTTTFMAMFDMLKNGKNVSFDEIIARQYALGGIDLLKIPHHKKWKKEPAEERVEFLKDFYKFAKQYPSGTE